MTRPFYADCLAVARRPINSVFVRRVGSVHEVSDEGYGVRANIFFIFFVGVLANSDLFLKTAPFCLRIRADGIRSPEDSVGPNGGTRVRVVEKSLARFPLCQFC